MKGPHWLLITAAVVQFTFSLQRTLLSFFPVLAAHIICHATVPDLGLRGAARPPTDRLCLSQRGFFLRTQEMHTLPWKKDKSCVILPSLKTGQIPEHTVSSPWTLAPHRDNNCRVYIIKSPQYWWQSSKSGCWLIKVLHSHWCKFVLFGFG